MEDVESIRLSPSDPTTEVGLTVQFTAEALDASGEVLADVDFTWSSSDPSVATVNDNGLASGVDVGTAQISAAAGSATPATQLLTVEPTGCEAPVEVILEPGQHQSYDATTCLLLPSGSSGDRYRVTVTRPTVISDPLDTTFVWLEVEPVATAAQVAGTETPSPALVPPATYATRPALPDDGGGIDGTQFARDHELMERTRSFHRMLRERERELGLDRGPRVVPRTSDVAAAPALADPPSTDRFYLDIDCTVTTPTPVRLIDFNDHIAIYQDSASNAQTPLSATATAEMLSYYASHVADFADAYWGPPSDIDGNGRILVTTAPALADTVAAAVFSGDFRPTSSCASSNEAEIIYFSEEVIQNVDPGAENRSYLALSVLAHEQKHVVSLYNGIARGAFHDTWIEEGTAEVAQTKSSRVAWAAVGGPPLGSVLDGQDIRDWNSANNGIGPEAWGVVVQLSTLVVWGSTQPNSLVTNPAGADSLHTFYAGGWHWHRFLGDAFGGASTPLADSALFREMNDSLTPAGSSAPTAVTGRTFEQLFEDVTVAAALHDAGPTPARAFTTWDLTTAADIFSGPPPLATPHQYPWPVTTDLEGNEAAGFGQAVYSCPPRLEGDAFVLSDPSDRCPMGPSGHRVHDFVSDGTGAGARVRVFGARSGTIVVTRLD